MEDVIERMRFDINVEFASPRDDHEVNSFLVSFKSSNPRTAMRVTERLAALFVQENVEERANLVETTDSFLKSRLEALGRRLLDVERRLNNLNRTNSIELNTISADREVALETYKKVLMHSEMSRVAVSLERRQFGEQFKIIDGARLPERPISPRLFPYLALGALAGLGARIAIAPLLFVWRRGRPRPAAAA